MAETNLTVAELGKIAGCHRNTVLNYEKRGHIRSMRDNNNFRRYSLRQALKLKEILSLRKPSVRCFQRNGAEG
jgi:DNA-binding transcriptional MerR regulator